MTRGTPGAPLLFCPYFMPSSQELIAFVQPLIEEYTAGTDIFLVRIKVKPTANVKVYLDADSGLTVEKCISINRRLRAAVDAAELFPEGDYSIEISSPGVDEPLTLPRQFTKNIGRTLEVIRPDDSSVTGVLQEVTEATLTLEVAGLKKTPSRTEVIPLSEVKTATVQIVF